MRSSTGSINQARNAVRVLRGHPSNQRLNDVPTIAANSLALVVGIATAIVGWARLHAYEVVWVILVFLVPLLTGTGESLDRYWLAAFPIFFLIGWWLRRWPIVAVGLVTVLLLVYIEIVQLGAVCIWCSAAHVLVLSIFLIALTRANGARVRT